MQLAGPNKSEGSASYLYHLMVTMTPAVHFSQFTQQGNRLLKQMHVLLNLQHPIEGTLLFSALKQHQLLILQRPIPLAAELQAAHA